MPTPLRQSLEEVEELERAMERELVLEVQVAGGELELLLKVPMVPMEMLALEVEGS